MSFTAGLIVASVGLAAAAEPGASAPTEELQQVQKAIAQHQSKRQVLNVKAAALAHEVGQIRAKTVDLATRITALEAAVFLARRHVEQIAAAERQAKAHLEARRRELGQILGALLRLSRVPSDALLVSPEKSTDTYRASLLLRALVPELRQRANRLATEIARFSALEAASAREQADLLAERSRLSQSRGNLRQLLAAKAAAERRTAAARTEESRRLDQLAARATSLKGLIAKIAAEEKRERALSSPNAAEAAAAATKAAAARLAALPTPAEPVPGGWLRWPADGRVINRFGMKNALGMVAKGVTIATVPDALVVAPRAGRVVFAGPFRGYGLLLIIKQAEGYHLLMAGLARIDANVGEWLVAGEPVGQMGGNGDGKSRLYVELRRNDTSVDPMPWLMASKRKVSG